MRFILINWAVFFVFTYCFHVNAQPSCQHLFSSSHMTSIQKAKALALKYHDQRGQLYSSARQLPYSYHLEKVEHVIERFSFLFNNSELKTLKTAAWLHDILEDTPVTYKMIKEDFGTDMANLVFAVSRPEVKLDSRIRKQVYLNRIRNHPLGLILKLADRIANIEEGARGGELKEKYQQEALYWRQQLPHLTSRENALFLWMSQQIQGLP